METSFVASRPTLPPVPRRAGDCDPGQAFVARLRAAAPVFAAAAGAQSAVVREAVPPARHRRSRCRIVLRYAEGDESDLTFLGPAIRLGTVGTTPFDVAIQRWLSANPQPEEGWLVPDDEAPDGLAVDVTAWLATG